MKKRPERRTPTARRGSGAPLALAGILLAAGVAAQVPENLSDDWYHVELLVFVREDAASLGAERWDPLPALSYPQQYRYLIDPERAERRLAESLAYASAIDERGIQRLTVPAPVQLLDGSERPDARIDEPYQAPDPNLPLLLGADGDALSPAAGGGEPESPDDADPPDATEEETPPAVLLALPEQRLADQELAFGGQARTLRRRGERIVFHSHWWSRMAEGAETLPLVIDRAADTDASAWPDLQGTVHLYRSRFLHIDVDLWLNTMASYLPAGWQIEPPPLAAPSLLSATLTGEALDPWKPLPVPFADVPDAAAPGAIPGVPGEVADPIVAEDPDAPAPDAPPAPEEDDLAARYPWRHAITHRQSRRMRSGETHYLDHPVIGVIVRIRPADEALLPFAAEDELAFRERHGLPVEYLPLPAEDED